MQTPGQSKIAGLVNQAMKLKKNFKSFSLSMVNVNANGRKHAFKLARDAIISQIAWSEEGRNGKSLKETCAICFEDTEVNAMFSVEDCLHRYCFSCMRKHVQSKLLEGMTIKCPHDGCNSEVNIDSCGRFLEPSYISVMSQRIKEASIPVTERVYCPYPRCSALMSKEEVLQNSKSAIVRADTFGARKCTKCQLYFCVDCKVPWHYNVSCQDYRRLNATSVAEDAKLTTLARQNLWRQCIKCNHMVELAYGCYHITCRSFLSYTLDLFQPTLILKFNRILLYFKYFFCIRLLYGVL